MQASSWAEIQVARTAWIGEGGLAALQLLLGWWLWRLLTMSRRDSGWPGLLAGGLLSLVVVHGVGARLLQTPPTIGGQADLSEYSVGLWQPAIPTRENFLRNANGICPDAYKLRFKRLMPLLRTG